MGAADAAEPDAGSARLTDTLAATAIGILERA